MEASDKRSWQTAYIKFAGIEEGKKKKALSKWGKVTGEGCGSNDNCLMHFHRGLSLAANAKGWRITKKKKSKCVICCLVAVGLHRQFCSCWFAILRLWGLYSHFNVPVNFWGLLRFVLCVWQQKKNELITERNALFSLTAGQKKKNIQWAFPIMQGSLLMSGNVLNSYPRGVSDTMTHIHERSSVTRRSQLLPVTHNSWSKLKCQKNSCQTAASLFCLSYNDDEQPHVCA